MSMLKWFFLLVFLIGCDVKTQPIIKTEHSGLNYFKITYEKHVNGSAYVILTSSEELKQYKQQLLFVIEQMEVAEQRMKLAEK